MHAIRAALLVLLFLVPAVAPAAPAAETSKAARPFSAAYDAEIREASAQYLPAWDWRWWKAQLYAESGLDPAAVSPVGARGLAQIMPATNREISRALGLGLVSPHDAAYAIEAGAYYMARQRAAWTSQRPESERRRLAQASYNAGLGHILGAQKACLASGASPCRDWPQLALYLGQVTGVHANETRGYVTRIERLFLAMGGAL